MKFGRLRLQFLQPINHNISFMCLDDTAKRQSLCSVLSPLARSLSEREDSMKLHIKTGSFMASLQGLDTVHRKGWGRVIVSGQSNNSWCAMHMVKSLLVRDHSSSASSGAYIDSLTLHAHNGDPQIAITYLLAPNCNT